MSGFKLIDRPLNSIWQHFRISASYTIRDDTLCLLLSSGRCVESFYGRFMGSASHITYLLSQRWRSGCRAISIALCISTRYLGLCGWRCCCAIYFRLTVRCISKKNRQVLQFTSTCEAESVRIHGCASTIWSVSIRAAISIQGDCFPDARFWFESQSPASGSLAQVLQIQLSKAKRNQLY